MKINSIKLNNFYTNKRIKNTNIKNYQTSPILKANKTDSVCFTGVQEHFNEMITEAFDDIKTFDALQQSGVEFQKDAVLRKKEAFKFKLLYNIKADEFQELYNEMIKNGDFATIDDDGNDVALVDTDDLSKQTLIVTKNGDMKYLVQFENGKIKLISLYNEDGSANVLEESEDNFVVILNAIKKDEDSPSGYEKIYHTYNNGEMTYDENISKAKNENNEDIIKIKKHYHYTNGELKDVCINDESIHSNNAISSKRAQTYYYHDGKLCETRLGETALNGAVQGYFKSCLYDISKKQSMGEIYKKECEFKPDGTKKIGRLFVASAIGFFENIIQRLEDDDARAEIAYIYDSQSGNMRIVPNPILKNLS